MGDGTSSTGFRKLGLFSQVVVHWKLVSHVQVHASKQWYNLDIPDASHGNLNVVFPSRSLTWPVTCAGADERYGREMPNSLLPGLPNGGVAGYLTKTRTFTNILNDCRRNPLNYHM